jgi:hypothetical protein
VFRREGRKAGKSIPVPTEVKKAIALTLKDSNGQISDGTFALNKHGISELYWACQTGNDFTLAHVLLTWHIATSYCEISEVNEETDIMHPGVQPSRTVATSLSKYCAYLVTFVPELVPGISLETQDTLDDQVYEARKVFWRRPDMYQRLRELGNEGTEEGILSKGARLGMRLEI